MAVSLSSYASALQSGWFSGRGSSQEVGDERIESLEALRSPLPDLPTLNWLSISAFERSVDVYKKIKTIHL